MLTATARAKWGQWPATDPAAWNQCDPTPEERHLEANWRDIAHIESVFLTQHFSEIYDF